MENNVNVNTNIKTYLGKDLNKNTTCANQGNTPLIFSKKLKNNTKVIPLRAIVNRVGRTRHFTPASQEWFNSVYAYNKNYTKLLPTADKQLMKLVRSYFNLYIKKHLNYEEKKSKSLATRFRRLSVKRIFVGKGDLKHTSTKVIITLYVYNYERRKFMVKHDEEVRNWFNTSSMYLKKYSKQPLVRKLANKNVFFSYENWFNWKSYELLNKKSLDLKNLTILERFYFKKFFGRLSLPSNRAGLVNTSIINNQTKLVNDKPLYIYIPLYKDYVQYISNSNLSESKKPSFDNFLNLIRVVSVNNIKNLKNNNLDLSEKTLYLGFVKDFLSRLFFVNKKLTKVILNLDALKTLKGSLGARFKYRFLIRRFLILKRVLHSYKGKTGIEKKKALKSFNLKEYMFILSNINIKNLIDLRKKNVDFRDITLYINHINKYLNKNLYFVHKKFIISLLNSLLSKKTRNINFSDKTIYLEYYKYIFSGKFSHASHVNNPSFDEFKSLLDEFSVDDFEYLKKKYQYYNTLTKLKFTVGKIQDFNKVFEEFNKINYTNLKRKKRSIILKNIREGMFKNYSKDITKIDIKDIISYSTDNLYKLGESFRQRTLKNYFKKTYLSLHKLIFNQNKFTNSFMKYLIRLVSNLYNKKVLFNIVDITKLHLNSDIYTQAVSLKLKNRKNRIYRVLKNSLSRVKMPLVKRIKNKQSNRDADQLLLNKVRNIKINTILVNYISNKDPLNVLLFNLYSKVLDLNNQSLSSVPSSTALTSLQQRVEEKSKDLYNEYSIIKSLKHINMAGIRVEAKGRLTRRFTASRSIFKMKWIGGLKNVDSSFKNLSTVVLRGNTKSNVLYSNVNSKNRNGAFGVKGWVSSK